MTLFGTCRRARVHASAHIIQAATAESDSIITIRIYPKPEIDTPHRYDLPSPKAADNSPHPGVLRTWSGVLPKELVALGSAPASKSFRTSSRSPRAAALHSRSPEP